MAEKKLTVLEIYQKRGWLDNKKSMWSASDRVGVGLQLRDIREQAGLGAMSAIDYEKERVDCSIKMAGSHRETAESLYFKATGFIPKEFRYTVINVCCDNRYIKAQGVTNQEIMSDRHLQIIDLCRGLDYLIEFFLFRKKSLMGEKQ